MKLKQPNHWTRKPENKAKLARSIARSTRTRRAIRAIETTGRASIPFDPSTLKNMVTTAEVNQAKAANAIQAKAIPMAPLPEGTITMNGWTVTIGQNSITIHKSMRFIN